jgi:hypothetical protein
LYRILFAASAVPGDALVNVVVAMIVVLVDRFANHTLIVTAPGGLTALGLNIPRLSTVIVLLTVK